MSIMGTIYLIGLCLMSGIVGFYLGFCCGENSVKEEK